MEKDDEGNVAIARIILRPEIVFSGASQSTAIELDALHHDAHTHCYIANSIKARVVVEAV